MLGSLLARNIVGFRGVQSNHKHFFQDLDQIKRADPSRTLFVYITREPVAWIHSLCKTPYHTHFSMKNIGVSAFLGKKVLCGG